MNSRLTYAIHDIFSAFKNNWLKMIGPTSVFFKFYVFLIFDCIIRINWGEHVVRMFTFYPSIFCWKLHRWKQYIYHVYSPLTITDVWIMIHMSETRLGLVHCIHQRHYITVVTDGGRGLPLYSNRRTGRIEFWRNWSIQNMQCFRFKFELES